MSSEIGIRYSFNEPVEVGMIRYVAFQPGEKAAAHVVISVESPHKIWSEEYRSHETAYPYRVRRATEAEEAAYLALLAPRSAGIGLGSAADYRAPVEAP